MLRRTSARPPALAELAVRLLFSKDPVKIQPYQAGLACIIITAIRGPMGLNRDNPFAESKALKK